MDSPRLVLLITIDTLRADHLGSYGHERARTPNLDRLANAGVRFERVTTTSNNTLPAHAAILTGRYPQSLGIPRNSFPLAVGEQTLAQIFRQHGYETAAFISAAALSSPMGLDAGFEVYDEQFSVQEIDQEQRRAQETTDAVLAWLSRPELGRAFVWVHYFDPHYPYTPPAPYDRIYGDDYAGLADGSMEYLAGLWAKGSARTQASDADIQRLVDLYDGEIAYTDSQVGRLIAAIDESGLGEDSIIALTADHGESLTEHDYLFNHGLYLYEPSLRVPLILRLPPSFGVEATVVGAQVQTLDLFPTLLEAAGLEVPEETEGLSLLPLIRGDRESVRELSFAEAARPWKVERRYPGQYRNLHKAQVVVEGPWKLIVTPHRDKKELYHTGRDPGEQSNQIAEHTMVSSRLYHALREWRREDLPGDAVPTPENLRRLKALGYVE